MTHRKRASNTFVVTRPLAWVHRVRRVNTVNVLIRSNVLGRLRYIISKTSVSRTACID